jgi:hypothetical protein
VEEETGVLLAHEGEDGTIDAYATKKIGVHYLLHLIDGGGFGEARERVACVVDGNVDAAGLIDAGVDSAVDGGFVGDVHFEDMELERFFSSEGAEFRGIRRIASNRIAHGGEDDVAVAG